MSEKAYCVYCGSMNVEQTTKYQYLCCSCQNVFTSKDLRFCGKILRKKALLKCEEMTMKELLHSSLCYIRGFGINLIPNLEKDLRLSIKSGEPIEISLSKLSSLEISAEDIVDSVEGE